MTFSAFPQNPLRGLRRWQVVVSICGIFRGATNDLEYFSTRLPSPAIRCTAVSAKERGFRIGKAVARGFTYAVKCLVDYFT